MFTHPDSGPYAGTPRSRWWTASLAALLGAAAVYVVGVFLRADPDLWGHVRFGQLTLELGYLPRVDPYSFLSRPAGWINHEWLSEVIFATSFDALGVAGLRVIPSVTIAGIVVGGFVHLVSRGLNATRAAVLSAVALLGLKAGGSVVRPHLFTYVAFFLVALAINSHESDGRVVYVGLLPLLFPVWAALHGGFLAGLGLLALATAGAIWRWLAADAETKRGALRSAGLYAAALLAAAALTGLGPYGYELPAFLVETATVPRPEITEWQPLDLRSFLGVTYLLPAAITVFVAVRAGSQWTCVEATIMTVLALLPLTAVRHVPLFVLGFLVLVAPKLDTKLWQASGAGRVNFRGTLTMINFALAAFLLWGSASELNCIEYPVRSDSSTDFPKAGVQAVAGMEDISRLAVHFNWGEYIIWHLGPEVQVSVDGRRETVYSDSVYQLNLSVMAGTGEWHRNLQSLRPDAALYPVNSPTDNLLQVSHRWRLAYRDSIAALHVPSSRRPGVREVEAAREIPAGPLPCFPR